MSRNVIFSCLLLISINTSMALTQQEHTALTAHNHLRKLHGAPALVWDETLANYARHHAARCEFKHSHGKYGENLSIGFPTVTDAIHAWYAEHTDYDYTKPHFSMKTGHFTQLVWKSTTHLGCALVDCTGQNGLQGDYLVCEYNPPGNITNKSYFQNNVTSLETTPQ